MNTFSALSSLQTPALQVPEESFPQVPAVDPQAARQMEIERMMAPYREAAMRVLMTPATAVGTAMGGLMGLGQRAMGTLRNPGPAIERAVDTAWIDPRMPDLAKAQDVALNWGPNAVGMMVGPKAVGFDKMRQFSNMADRMPRAEISDDMMRLKKESFRPNYGYNQDKVPYDEVAKYNQSKLSGQVYEANFDNIHSYTAKGTVGEIIDHNKLFSAYPKMKDIKIEIDVDPNLPITKTGGYTLTGKANKINKIKVMANTEEQALSLILHELQHPIQVWEKFSLGGSADYLKYLLGDTSSFDDYKRLAGEIEARDTAARMGLTDAERMSNMPYASQGIPLKDWIVRKEGGPAASIKRDAVNGVPVNNYEELIRQAGGRFKGVNEMPIGKRFVWFDDPVTGSTLGLPESEATVENIARKLKDTQANFKASPAKGGAPAKSSK